MQFSVKLLSSAVLAPEKNLPLPTECNIHWAPEAVKNALVTTIISNIWRESNRISSAVRPQV
jgi:hypothetical protein